MILEAEAVMILEEETALDVCANGQTLQDIKMDDGRIGTYMQRCVPYLPKC
jgi:hypothetical protein